MSATFKIFNLDHFPQIVAEIAEALLEAKPVRTSTWQSQDVSQRPEMVTHEVTHARVELPVPNDMLELAAQVGANLPWAEDHFQERISGEPLNPPPSEQWWPYAVNGNNAHKAGQRFSHTYPERFWPKYAEQDTQELRADDQVVGVWRNVNRGIRYNYGDLADVVNLLKRDLYTRQAYLPVWFPEDTGAVEGQRVPCTLGYHFLYREQLDVEYHIRSCDFMRHWRDDIYMAGRLMQWMSRELSVEPGNLIMNVGSLHIFAGDRSRLETMLADIRAQANQRFYSTIVSAL